jgi:hypothetical protein
MTIGKARYCQIISRHRNRAKKFLKKTDIVGEGERWVGGLLSFAIVVLFGFTFWFAADYLQLYPLEKFNAAHASCNYTIRNAIFDMLDAQPFAMTLDLDCSTK